MCFAKSNGVYNKEQYKIDFDTLKQTIFDCAQIDKKIVDKISNKDINTYLVYDDFKSISYINYMENNWS
jgi:hypothetical protein